jgi:hypothetical protein
MTDDYGEYYSEDEGASYPRDQKVDDAKEVLLSRFFPKINKDVYYGRQLEIWLEKDFYHWITKKALNELVQERKIGYQAEKAGYLRAHFYYPRLHRYPRRQINEMVGLIGEFSDPTFTRALGHCGEQLADAAFARVGFRILQSKVREVDGKAWGETGHDLDRLIERDGVRYGVEIKNTLGYIEQTEFQVKLRMCGYLGVRPMFIARMMPKSYIYEVYLAGGFCLILLDQHYPLMSDALATRVRDRLKLPVTSIREYPDTALQRFEKWHEGSLSRVLPR